MNRTMMVRLAAVFACLALTAAQQSCENNCNVIQLGNKKALCHAPPSKASTGDNFAPGDYRFTCVGDAGKGCDAPENAVVPNNETLACCGCFLYARYCAGKSDFVTDHAFDPAHDHVKLMPAAACTGVENWNSNACGNEGIWDKGANILDTASKPGGWGMAINPISRRGQHQMHVHLAEVHGGLISAIVLASKKVNTTHPTAFITCKGRQTKTCTVQPIGYKGDRTQEIQVTIVTKTLNPAQAKPFLHAYGSNPAAASNKVMTLFASTLVVRVPGVTSKDSWAIVTNPTNPAECYFISTEGQCKE